MTKKPPDHLSSASKMFWRRTVRDYVLTNAELRILQAALEAWDRMTQARTVLEAEGLTYQDRFGAPRKHPAVSVEENARIAFLRAMRELGLPGPPDPEIDRRYRSGRTRARQGDEEI